MTIIKSVPTYRIPEAVKALEKLSKKAKKYGHEAITWAVSEPRVEEKEIPTGYYTTRKMNVRVADIILTGFEAAPKVGEYTFVAKIEIGAHGNVINKVQSEDLPEQFRTSSGYCEHCNHNRPRKNVFVVKDSEGKLVQIGSSCLRDFMGTDTPASVAARFTLIQEARELSDEYAGGKWTMDYHTEELLAVTNVAIRIWGWTPKSAAGEGIVPTATRIATWFYCHSADKQGQQWRDALKEGFQETDWEIGKAARDWCMSNDKVSDYFHNLRVILAADVVEEKYRGYAASSVSAYLKEMNALTKKEETVNQSNFVGSVGDKLKNLEVTCELARTTSSAWGEGVLYKFIDASGNVFSWFASSSKNYSVGEKLTISGTVKVHKEYKGVNETQLTRVK